MVLSLLFIILLRFLAGIMVWVMIVMVILVLGYGKSLPPCVLPSPLSAKCLCPWSCHCPSRIFSWDFPGGPVVKTSCIQCRGHGFNPWSGN